MGTPSASVPYGLAWRTSQILAPKLAGWGLRQRNQCEGSLAFLVELSPSWAWGQSIRMHVPEKAPSPFCPSCLLQPLPPIFPSLPKSPSAGGRPPPRLWPSPAPATPPSGNLRGLQALKWTPSPFSVSTVCCLTNSSSRKGEFIEEKDQSFCWKMLFPVLVSHFLTLYFHTQGQHILGVSVQEVSPQGTVPGPLKEKPAPITAKQGRARLCKARPFSPQVLSRTGSGGKEWVISCSLCPDGETEGQGRAVTFLRPQLR